MDQPHAFYEPDGHAFVGTTATQGGWDDRFQHGGAVEALLARCIELTPTLAPMQVSRLTYDLVRPVPVKARLDVRSTILREGKKIQLVQAVMLSGGLELARVVGLRLRIEDVTRSVQLPESTPVGDVPSLPHPSDAERVVPINGSGSRGLMAGIELRQFRPRGHPEGAPAYWSRVVLPVVLGEVTSDLVRLALVADFTNNIGVAVSMSTYTAINPDLTVQVVRPPSGSWIAITGQTRFEHQIGLGISRAELLDLNGVCAMSTTSKIVQPLE